MSVGVDPKCVELAHHFLDDVNAANDILDTLLAERIQGAVEDWMEEWFEQSRPPLRLVGDPRLEAAQRLAEACERVGVLAGAVPWDVGVELEAFRATEKKQFSKGTP